uniref:Uncharacterized protein n=1 Tax=Quercus lobata TaxID=97700 RepID=A0A7N2MCD9_QUELO
MYANNPKIVLYAMCLLLGSNSEKEIAFVQFSQAFYDGLKDDPYGNQLVVMRELEYGMRIFWTARILLWGNRMFS